MKIRKLGHRSILCLCKDFVKNSPRQDILVLSDGHRCWVAMVRHIFESDRLAGRGGIFAGSPKYSGSL